MQLSVKMIKISRKEAKAQGLKHYFTGIQCINGHTTFRFTANSTCGECLLATHKNYLKTEHGKAVQKAYDRGEKAKQAHRVRKKDPRVKKMNRRDGAKRRAAKLERTPSWVDHEAISRIYLFCPNGYEVDHIIPLQGKLVSGLHVPDNLQYLTCTENRIKYNAFEIE